MAKKLKLSSPYYFGKRDRATERRYLGTSQVLLDVTDYNDCLTDEMHLAFDAWPHWEKMGKNERYRENGTGLTNGVGGPFQKDPTGSIQQAYKEGAAVTSVPLLYDRDGTPFRAFRFVPPDDDVALYSFYSTQLLSMVLGLYGNDPDFIDFKTTGFESPLLVTSVGKPVALIAAAKDVDDELYNLGHGEFFEANRAIRDRLHGDGGHDDSNEEKPAGTPVTVITKASSKKKVASK